MAAAPTALTNVERNALDTISNMARSAASSQARDALNAAQQWADEVDVLRQEEGRRVAAENAGADTEAEGLAYVRDELRDELVTMAGRTLTTDPFAARVLRDLAEAYTRLGGDLELAPKPPPGPSALEQAAHHVADEVRKLTLDDFPDRLDDLVIKLNTLEAVSATTGGPTA